MSGRKTKVISISRRSIVSSMEEKSVVALVFNVENKPVVSRVKRKVTEVHLVPRISSPNVPIGNRP